MIIECDSCEVRGHACGDCVVGVLLGTPEPRLSETDGSGTPSGAPILHLDAPERRALDVLAAQGLVPRLRLVAARPRRTPPEADGGRSIRDAG